MTEETNEAGSGGDSAANPNQNAYGADSIKVLKGLERALKAAKAKRTFDI